MELIIAGLVERTSIPFFFHTLRRTGGRHYWECGVPIETIAKMMGHKSIDMTLRYIGVEMDDMQKAMEMGYTGASCGIGKIEPSVYRR